MAKKDALSSLILLGIGLFFLLYSRQYELGTLTAPGEAVFPMLIAVAVIVLAGWLFIVSIFKTKSQEEEKSENAAENNIRVLFLTVLVIAALLLMGTLGFFVTSFLLILLCCKLLGVTEWSKAVFIAAGAVLGAYLIFGFWLKVSFPTGLLI
ncbi:MAG: tripartite tricarboxylate transporter TctB family protein [Moorella humiferrea]|nr:tripartite tricarboxylate transporter TctB family protein [Moorella humiferrea]